MVLRVTHYSGDSFGGAGRAALRLHSALNQNKMIESRMIVAQKNNDDPSIIDLESTITGRFGSIIKRGIDAIPRKFSTSVSSIPRSSGFSTRLTAVNINSTDCDLAHLHWINGGFLSVEQIGKIKKPLIWTLHDMWVFCGAEHLSTDGSDARWRTGYKRTRDVKGFDIDRWVWRRKRSNWKSPFHIVTPSSWLAACAENSMLLENFPVYIIPNPLNTDIYKPIDKSEARKLLNLPQEKKLILFGAIKGTQLPYKGWDLLKPALAKLFNDLPGAEAVIFGQSQPAAPPKLGGAIHWMGHLYDDYSLAALYNAADVLVVPSRQESFGQTAAEAQACGCPVVAFNATGLKDVIVHNKTGLLVKPYCSSALAHAVLELLKNNNLRHAFSKDARLRASHEWSFNTVANKYQAVYEIALDKYNMYHSKFD